jgi:hypothetical protein
MTTGFKPHEEDSNYSSKQTPQNTRTAVSFGITLFLAVSVLIPVLWVVLPLIWPFVWYLVGPLFVIVVFGAALVLRPRRI